MSVSAADMDISPVQSAVLDDAVAVTPSIHHGCVSTGNKTTDLALEALDSLKAEQMVTFDLRGRSNVCDFMVIVSGRSNTHVGSLAENLSKTLKKNKIELLSVAGMEQCDWVVLDANSVVVHIFRPEVRSFYKLEKMWNPSYEIVDGNNALNSAAML